LSNRCVLVASSASLVKSLVASGVAMWEFTTPAGAPLRTHPQVAPNGAVYLATAGNVIALGAGGDLLWAGSLAETPPAAGP
jgi:hypothetical protein